MKYSHHDPKGEEWACSNVGSWLEIVLIGEHDLNDI